jgi:hypothetical protein
MSIEEEYQDVLQNIESAIVGVYREQSQLTDYQVDTALEALGRTYLREQTGGAPVLPKNALAKAVYERVKAMCDWRMGREHLVDEEGQPLNMEPLAVEVILACLKRVRKSVNYWNKQSGMTGYLDYVSQFLP